VSLEAISQQIGAIDARNVVLLAQCARLAREAARLKKAWPRLRPEIARSKLSTHQGIWTSTADWIYRTIRAEFVVAEK